jgi:hypothetical protein
LEFRNEAALGEAPEFGERKDIGIAVFRVEIDLLGIKPMDKEAEAVGVDIGECHALSCSLSEIAIKRRGEEGRIVANEVFVDDEGLFGIFRANNNRYYALRASIE